jgi:hypothetical protein
MAMHTNDQTTEKKRTVPTTTGKIVTSFGWLCVVLGFIAAFIGLFVTDHDTSRFSLSNLANFGSYAQGTVASLWSLGALLFLYATLLAQREQLKQQQQQLEEQRIQYEDEQERLKTENQQQSQQFDLQQQSIKLQSFENSFFQQIKLFNDVRIQTSIDYEAFTGEVTAYEGPNCFKTCRTLLTNGYPHSNFQRISECAPVNAQELKNAAHDYFMKFYEPYRHGLDHYFRQLYHIIKFVDSSHALNTDVEKRRYTSLVRAQLTDNELFLLFYNGVCPHAEKFRPLIEKYGLLEHLDRTLLLHEAHASFYENAYH